MHALEIKSVLIGLDVLLRVRFIERLTNSLGFLMFLRTKKMFSEKRSELLTCEKLT